MVGQMEDLQNRVKLLEDKVNKLETMLESSFLYQESKEAGKYKLIFTCRAFVKDNSSFISYIVRSPAFLKEYEHVVRAMIPNNLEETLLDCIYNTITSYNSIHLFNNSDRIKSAELHLNNKYIVQLLQEQVKTDKESIIKKVTIINEEIKALSLLMNRKFTILYKEDSGDMRLAKEFYKEYSGDNN